MSILSYFSASLLIICGIYFSFKSRFFQFRFKNIFSATFGKMIKSRDKQGFKAMSIALGSTIGIGNIIGVTAAILSGGPGAVFWMLLTGFTGMTIKYAEIYLSISDAKANNRKCGGPMYVMKNHFNGIFKNVGALYAVTCIIASLFAGNIIQSKSIYRFAELGFNVNHTEINYIILPLLLAILLGKDRLYQNFSSVFVPAMSIGYIIATFMIIFNNIENLHTAFYSIFSSAFGIKAAFGGFCGAVISKAIRIGVMKGLFTNEAGMGSSPIAHSSARNADPHIQGCWGIIEVFIDTVVVCMLTAIAILSTPEYINGNFREPFELISAVFCGTFGNFGVKALSGAAICFAFASIVGWSFYGIKALGFFTESRIYNRLYILIFIMFVPLSAFLDEATCWILTDIFNSLMLIPNTISLLVLRFDIKYLRSKK